MALDNLLTRLIAQIAKHEAKSNLLSYYGPPSRGDVLHDGLVGAGNTWGGILGTAAGAVGGEAAGGPRGAIAGSVALGTMGALGGAWAAHGAYREGQLIRDILSHPENWSVDAAGAIVPVMPAPNLLSNTNEPNDAGGADEHSPAALYTSQSLQGGAGTVGQNDSEPPVRFLGSRIQNPLGDGMADWNSSVDPSNPQYFAQPAPSQQQPGGLPGLMLDYLRDNPNN